MEWRSTERTGASERKVPVMATTDTRTGSKGVQPREIVATTCSVARLTSTATGQFRKGAPVGSVIGRVAEQALGGETRVRDPLTIG